MTGRYAGVRVVIPSLSAKVEELDRLVGELRDAGTAPVIVPTSSSLDLALAASDRPVARIGANPGFSATINHGAQAAPADWGWLLICNDDVEVEPTKLADCLATVTAAEPATLVMAYLDPVDPKPLPSAWTVFGTMSLMTSIVRRVVPSKPNGRGRTFKPFSCVLISRGLWDALGGLDERYVFTYEDSDFVRRSLLLGATVLSPTQTGVVHNRSATGRANIRYVVPASAWSAREYLKVSGMDGAAATALCLVALAVRLVVSTQSQERTLHWSSTLLAIRHLVTGRRPRLVQFELR